MISRLRTISTDLATSLALLWPLYLPIALAYVMPGAPRYRPGLVPDLLYLLLTGPLALLQSVDPQPANFLTMCLAPTLLLGAQISALRVSLPRSPLPSWAAWPLLLGQQLIFAWLLGGPQAYLQHELFVWLGALPTLFVLVCALCTELYVEETSRRHSVVAALIATLHLGLPAILWFAL